MDFEWDRRKAASNARKHGVSFEEASSVFYDAFARVIDDPEHSMNEERYIVLGISRLLRSSRGAIDTDHFGKKGHKTGICPVLEVSQ